jgi:hypothetical protein
MNTASISRFPVSKVWSSPSALSPLHLYKLFPPFFPGVAKKQKTFSKKSTIIHNPFLGSIKPLRKSTYADVLGLKIKSRYNWKKLLKCCCFFNVLGLLACKLTLSMYYSAT